MGEFIVLAIVGGICCAMFAFGLGFVARLVDPDVDWRAPLFLVSGVLLIFSFAVAPVIYLLALVGGFARTIAGILAIAETIALSGAVILIAIIRLTRER